MKTLRLLLCLLLLASAFFAGWRAGRRPVEVVETVRTVTVCYEHPEPVRVSHSGASVRLPLLLFAPADTVHETVAVQAGPDRPAPQPGLHIPTRNGLDLGLQRQGSAVPDSVEVRIELQTLEYGGRDTTFYAVVSGPAVGGFRPRLERLELYATERLRTETLREPFRWEVGPAAGAWLAPDGRGIWLGAYVRRSFGRFSVEASGGWATGGSAFAHVQAGVALWRK